MRPPLRLLAYASLGLLLAGCAGENEYDKAKKVDTYQAYADFLAQFPDSGLKDEAIKRRDAALWRETEAAAAPASYLSFLKKAPKNSPRLAEAKDKARKLLIDGKGNENDYRDYLNRFPNESGRDLLQALEQARFAALQDSHDADGFALFIAQYPGAPEAAKLGASLRRYHWAQAQKLGTRLAYQFFLKRHPSGAEADRAREKLAAFDGALPQEGTGADVGKLLPRLRRGMPSLIRRECLKGLTARLKRDGDLFTSAAEDLRDKIAQVAGSGDDPPELCADYRTAIPSSERQLVANAVHALAHLMERQAYLGDIFGGPAKITHDAKEIGSRAANLADDSETQELELEALYGRMPADPEHPEDTASKNARDAGRRAKRAWDLAHGINNDEKRGEAGEILRKMDGQSDMLLDVIAFLEKPVVPSQNDDMVEESSQ